MTSQQKGWWKALCHNFLGADLSSDSSASVAEPGTPGREEVSSLGAQKGYRLGTRQELSSTEAYDEVYEQANTLLKNLHFEWLHRKATV